MQKSSMSAATGRRQHRTPGVVCSRSLSRTFLDGKQRQAPVALRGGSLRKLFGSAALRPGLELGSVKVKVTAASNRRLKSKSKPAGTRHSCKTSVQNGQEVRLRETPMQTSRRLERRLHGTTSRFAVEFSVEHHPILVVPVRAHDHHAKITRAALRDHVRGHCINQLA